MCDPMDIVFLFVIFFFACTHTQFKQIYTQNCGDGEREREIRPDNCLFFFFLLLMPAHNTRVHVHRYSKYA